MKESNIKIAHVVAYDSNGVIGKGDDELPWSIKEDMAYFRKLTLGHAVVMGRKTHFSIGKELPIRFNVVVSSKPQFLNRVHGVCTIDSAIKDAMAYAKRHGQDKIFIIGGSEIYKATASIADEVYATLVKGEHEGDRYYQLPKGMEQVDCSGEQTNGVETFFFKHYVRFSNDSLN